jgi:hypothetical protein
MVNKFFIEMHRKLKLNKKEILLHSEIPIETRKFLKFRKNKKGNELQNIY